MNPRVLGAWLSCIILVAVVLAGCGSSKLMLQRNQKIPAASGEVRVSEGPNGNTRIEVRVQHLAPPDRLQAGATLFVAWARPLDSGGAIQNLGALVLDRDLKGRLETVTALRQFELLITAESTSSGDRPSSETLMSTEIRRK